MVILHLLLSGSIASLHSAAFIYLVITRTLKLFGVLSGRVLPALLPAFLNALHLRGAEEMMHGQETGDELTTDSLNIRGLWIFVFVCIHCR